jgi:hypothetical protein
MKRLGFSLRSASKQNNYGNRNRNQVNGNKNMEHLMIGLKHIDINMDVVGDTKALTKLDNANTHSPQDETFPRA